MTVTAEQVKQLREATGVGILDCQKALKETDGDYKKAVDLLREKGLAKAAKRADRQASEGVIELYSHGAGRVGDGGTNCEGDFVARSSNPPHCPQLPGNRDASPALHKMRTFPRPCWITTAHRPLRRPAESKPNHLDIIATAGEKFKTEVVLLPSQHRDENVTIEKC